MAATARAGRPIDGGRMPIGMPAPAPTGAFRFVSPPESRNACQLIHLGAIATINFKTAAFDRSATPPMQ
jgi:hypothetical protein